MAISIVCIEKLKTTETMYFKQLALSALSGFIILIFVNMGYNKLWFQHRIFNFSETLDQQLEFNTIEGRREFRWGEPYYMAKGIRQYIESRNDSVSNALVLLPPQEYCDKNGIRFIMPEPVICYYFSGLRTTRMNCKDVYDADYCLVSVNGNMSIQELRSKQDIDQVIQLYKATN